MAEVLSLVLVVQGSRAAAVRSPNGGVNPSSSKQFAHPATEGLGGDTLVGFSPADKQGNIVSTERGSLK